MRYRGDEFFNFEDPTFITHMLKNPEHYRMKGGVKCEIVHMTPETYLKESAKIHGSTVIRETMLIDKAKVKRYAEVMYDGRMVGLPWLDYKNKQQEGRYRVRAVFYMIEMQWIEPTLVPVAIIKEA
jgi:hypothetical protein